MLRQLVAGREEEDFMEEVCAQMLWKCSRGGQPDSRQEHKAQERQDSRVHVMQWTKPEDFKVLLPT